MQLGDWVASGAPHATYACLEAATAMRVADGMSDEDAIFWMLG